ncbi:M60 family metallopeptidase [Frankia sp. Cas4]|uniref:M60 family metallopeptidase n=1 Tax=Frankia sp. Cas4 TaxID=3073927 RepID=UPI002AD29AB2|nr:M60 family metallopeptidase [Frankia sp. Cas4]
MESDGTCTRPPDGTATVAPDEGTSISGADIVLTMADPDVRPEPYAGNAWQSFHIVDQADGSVGIRNPYTHLVLTMSDQDVRATPYTGNAWQSFWIVDQADGSVGIRNNYYGTALTMSDEYVRATPYAGNAYQSFVLVPQADGSTGIRSFYQRAAYSTFWGTPDTREAIKRVGNWYQNSDRQPTGFYLPPENRLELRLRLVNLAADSQPTLYIGAPDTHPDFRTYMESRPYPLHDGLNYVTDPAGGMVYFQMTGVGRRAEVTFRSGVVKAPFFEHGKTTPEQYRNMLATLTQAPQAELASKRVIVTVDRAAALKYQDVDQNALMETYEKIVSVEEAVLGLDGSMPLHTPAPLRFHLTLGNRSGVGSAHAAHYYTTYAVEYGAELLTVAGLATSWGMWHELGHQSQMFGYLHWDDLIEITVNIASLAVQRAFGQRSRLLETDAGGKDIWDKVLAKINTPSFKVTDLDPFEYLAALEQLRLAFGDDFWPRMNKVTREKYQSDGYRIYPPQPAYDNLALFASITANADLRGFFAAWGIPVTEARQAEIAALNLPRPATDPTTLREPRS